MQQRHIKNNKSVESQIEEYKIAVWAFLVEHTKVLPSGKMRIIFDTDNRRNFEKRVWARYKYNYHREDWETKDNNISVVRDKWQEKKKNKKSEYLAQKKSTKEIKAMLEAVYLANKAKKGPLFSKVFTYILILCRKLK